MHAPLRQPATLLAGVVWLVPLTVPISCANVRPPPNTTAVAASEFDSALSRGNGAEPASAGAPTSGGSGAPAKKGQPRAKAPAPGQTEQGLASYYGNALAGNKTASGERYDPAELSAAHRTLPFGTLVEVRRKDGRSVRVRINDRGPFVDGRVVDLSRRAAQQLGMLREGVVSVTLRVVAGPRGE